MIKNLILTAAMLLSTSIYAQQPVENNDQIPGLFDLNKPMKCLPVNNMFFVLQNEFEEKLSWIGKVDNTSSYIAMYKNTQTGNWTLIQHDSAVGCFLGSGKDSTPL